MSVRKLERLGGWRAAAVAVVAFALVAALRSAGSLERLELLAYDATMSIVADSAVQDPRIVLVGIREADIERLGAWPIPDAALARILRMIAADGPRAIGVDLYRDKPVPDGAPELNEVILEVPAIVTVYLGGERGSPAVESPAALRGTNRVGFSDVLPDPGGVVRRVLLFAGSDPVEASFPYRLATMWLAQEGVFPQPDPREPEALRLGSTTLHPLERKTGGYRSADARGYQILLDISHGVGSFRTIGASEVLEGKLAPGTFRDRIVLIGSQAASVPDLFMLPLLGSNAAATRVFGVELQATVTAQILRVALGESPPVRSWTDAAEWIWIALGAAAGATLCWMVRSPGPLAAAGVALIVAFAGAACLAARSLIWIPSVPPILASIVAGTGVIALVSKLEASERRLLMRLFERHVSKEIAETIWKQRDTILAGGRLLARRVPVTVLFGDLKGYSAMAEQMEPATLMTWTQEFTAAMAEEIMRHGGVVDDYAGDGIKADFGVPLPRLTREEEQKDAASAVRCGLAMARRIDELRHGWHARGLPRPGMRIGIASGSAVAGIVGGGERLKYTVVGDVVNVAARLESFDAVPHDFASRPCRILASGTTRDLLGDEIQVDELGTWSVKGRDGPVRVCRVLGLTGEPEGSAA